MPPASLLHFGSHDGKTVVLAARAELPLILQRPIRGPAGQAVVTLLTPAGALFGGDSLHLEVCCESGTDVTLTTAAATKLNRGPIDVTMRVQVAGGATFRYLPHELIPFQYAHYAQRIDVAIETEADSHVALLEVIGPGASDSRFSYASLTFASSIRIAGELAVRERFSMTSRSARQLGGHSHYGSLLHIGDWPVPPELSGFGGVSRLPRDGWVAKALGMSAQLVRASLLAALPGSGWLLPLLPA